jgi:ElaB/YqjD/DUF883 family membrane-anchored ribosome-binding protein
MVVNMADGDISTREFDQFVSFVTQQFKDLKAEVAGFRELLAGLVTRSEFESQELKVKELQRLVREAELRADERIDKVEEQAETRIENVENFVKFWRSFWKWTFRVVTAVLIGVTIALVAALLSGWLQL